MFAPRILPAARLPALNATLARAARFSTSPLRRNATEEAVAVASAPLPYFVHRSNTNNLPVYEEAKRGGNLHQTRIRKLEGDLPALREQLITALNLPPERISINSVTQHIIIKGHYKNKVVKFLEGKRF